MASPCRLILLVAFVIPHVSWGQPQRPPPPAPAQTVPELSQSKVTVQCVGCDKPFGTGEHKKILADLIGNEYAAELRRALYFQDSVHQFESKAHFDNCDFDGAVTYIDKLLEEADGHVKKAEAAKRSGGKAESQKWAKSAFFAIGQALHSVQDFYAHSNYIELKKDSVKDATDIPVVPFWTPRGKEELTKLRESGLISGYVFWGFPQNCQADSPSHAQLAKDDEGAVAGKVRVPHLENLSQFRLATVAARQASADFMAHVFARWPTLSAFNGNRVAYEIFVDRRGL